MRNCMIPATSTAQGTIAWSVELDDEITNRLLALLIWDGHIKDLQTI